MLNQNGRLGSPSQRSLSSNSEYAPVHYHNVPLPVHLRPQRLLSRRVSEPSDGRHPSGIVYQNHNPGALLNHMQHSTRLRGGVNGLGQFSVANLDFHSPKSQSPNSRIPRLNGITNPLYSNHELRNQLEDVGLRQELLDSDGMRNENGSDSNTSTLCGSSHSSTLDNKNRLSRVSEKSEHNENDGEQRVNTYQKEQSSVCGKEKLDNVDQNSITTQEKETSEDPPTVAEQQSTPAGSNECNPTLPNHYRNVQIQQSPLAVDPRLQVAKQLGYPQSSPLSPSSSFEQDTVSSVLVYNIVSL